jgi:hypothetical protein
MKIVPVIKSRDLERSVRFCTKVLDFERKWPDDEDREKANGVAHLIREGCWLQWNAATECNVMLHTGGIPDALLSCHR